MKKLLFSVTKKDLDLQTFCTGGPGGQNQNRNKNGVRIRHRESGAVGECRELKAQAQNRKRALDRLLKHPKWKIWHARRVFEETGAAAKVEEKVEQAMQQENLRIEVQTDKGWVLA